MSPDIHALTAALLKAIGKDVETGSVTLSFNEGQVQSVRTETFQRVAKVAPKRTT